ncbi:MAG: hypothetical protein JRD94_16580 [Deltaproteobacteria bacterium]|nr:hypothetical protein [Deltaproteobacteria bacterium]
MAALLVAAPLAASPLEHRELVAERAHSLRIAVAIGLTNRLTELTFEPRVESPIDLPLCVPVAVGSGLLPAFRDPNDLFEVLSLVEVRTMHVVRRPRRPVNRPSRIVERTRRLHTRSDRPHHSRTTPGGDHDGRMPVPTPPILRIRLSHSAQRQNKNPKVK